MYKIYLYKEDSYLLIKIDPKYKQRHGLKKSKGAAVSGTAYKNKEMRKFKQEVKTTKPKNSLKFSSNYYYLGAFLILYFR